MIDRLETANVGVLTISIVSVFCVSIGISSSNAASVISILSAFNVVSRILTGYLGDRFGYLNLLSVFQFTQGLVCVVCWIFADTYGKMIGFAILFGFFAGGEQR